MLEVCIIVSTCRLRPHIIVCECASCAHTVLVCETPGSPRRVGGQGDVLAGAVGAFSSWAQILLENKSDMMKDLDWTCVACLGASMTTRIASRLAYKQHARSMLSSEVVNQAGVSLDALLRDCHQSKL